MFIRISFALLVLLFAGTARGQSQPSTTQAAEDQCVNCHRARQGTAFNNDIHHVVALNCTDCHGGDSTASDRKQAKLAEKGFRPKPARQEIPLFCAGCHNNAKFIATYKANPVVNQYALYTRSVHGKAVAAGSKGAAECVDCHGVHDIRAASDRNSPISQANVSATCGKCHVEEAALWNQNRTHRGRTNCVTCHGSHDAQTATAELLTGANAGCGRCHRGNTRPAQAAAQMADYLNNLQNAGADSKAALQRARVAVHSFNVASMQRAATAPPAGGVQTAPAATAPAAPTPRRGLR
jgi:hypothetical protein